VTLFNTTYHLGDVLDPLTQDEISLTPEFFAMSYQDVLESGKCPPWLRRVLLALPWTNRPNFVQVRPQDFRGATPHVLGGGWHVDVNTGLANGVMHWAKSLDEFRSMVVSFGDVAETEFIRKPFEVADERVAFDHCAFHGLMERMCAAGNVETVALQPNQVATYGSRDVHRISPKIRHGRMRLIIVTVELDVWLPKEGGRIGPSIRERGRA
jgi:hypothetical protein